MPSIQNPSSASLDWESMFVDADDAEPGSASVESDDLLGIGYDTDTQNSDHQSPNGDGSSLESERVAESEGEDNVSEPANLESVDTLAGDGDDATKLTLSDFDLQGADDDAKALAERLITNFDEIKPYMAPILATHLARTVIKLWEQCRAEGLGYIIHCIVKRLNGDYNMTQDLSYPWWFFVASQYGSGDDVLDDAREDMTYLWGQKFSIYDINYPEEVPIHNQIRMYFGINPDADDPETIAKLAQHLETLIETSPVTQITDMMIPQLPTSSTHDQGIEEVRKMAQNADNSVRSTLEHSRATRAQLHKTREELKKSRKELKRTQQELKQTRIELNALAQVHAEIKDKAERALRVSAMLLGNHLTPNSNKRKRGSDDNEL